MIIVQLSDIHVGSQFKEETFEQVIEEVNELKPDAVIVTGDLTNEGLSKEYEKCRSLLARLDTKKIISLPGNHTKAK